VMRHAHAVAFVIFHFVLIRMHVLEILRQRYVFYLSRRSITSFSLYRSPVDLPMA
jgi:hypothetical protein